jgi:uncharacterized membrane protein
MVGYIQVLLLILLGAFLNEGGITLTRPIFWVIIIIILGIMLTFDVMTRVIEEDEENPKGP